MKRTTILAMMVDTEDGGVSNRKRRRVVKMLKLFNIYNKPKTPYPKDVDKVRPLLSISIGYVLTDILDSVLYCTRIATLRELMSEYSVLHDEDMTDIQLLQYLEGGGLHSMLTFTITKWVANKYSICKETSEMDEMTTKQLIALSRLSWYTRVVDGDI